MINSARLINLFFIVLIVFNNFFRCYADEMNLKTLNQTNHNENIILLSNILSFDFNFFKLEESKDFSLFHIFKCNIKNFHFYQNTNDVYFYLSLKYLKYLHFDLNNLISSLYIRSVIFPFHSYQ